MFLKSNNYFSISTFEHDFKYFKKEFERVRVNENIKRAEVFAMILILINVLLIIIDLSVYQPFNSKGTPHLYLYRSHIAMLIFLILWISVLFYNKKYHQFIYKKLLNNIFLYVNIGWCTFLGINSIRITGGITAYIICMFCCATFFLTDPIEAIATYFISAVIFIGGMLIVDNSSVALYSNIINVIITILLIQVASIIKYIYFCKDFSNKQYILRSKEELEVANQKLKEYEETRTDFFANISHELRTPLNVIWSAEQMINSTLEDSYYDNDKMKKYLKMIKQNTSRLLRLINNLIDITKIDAECFKVKCINADIIKIVEDITLSVADFIQHQGISLIFDTEAEEKIIACDPDQIERIMLNLLSNAVKYGKKEGTIFVNVFLEPEQVCISVKDNGIGISEEMQEHIFKRFVQVDKSFQRTTEGSGIGLALVKALVEMHGGDISVKSEIEEGSEFIIKLPDIKVTESEKCIPLPQTEEKYTHRINIEFSDIYQ